MSARILAGALLALAAGAGLITAAASAAAGPSCEQARADALTVVHSSPIRTPDGWTVRLACGESADGRLGQAVSGAREITIWVQPAAPHLEWIWVHEAAHAWDMDGRLDRGTWAFLRGLDPADGWWIHELPAGRDWWYGGAEDFAEAFATCHLGGTSPLAVVDWTPPTDVECDLALAAGGGR